MKLSFCGLVQFLFYIIDDNLVAYYISQFPGSEIQDKLS